MTSRYATSPLAPSEPSPVRDPGADARTLAGLQQLRGRPVLVKGAVILSQDLAVGDYAAGDILIRDSKITQVGEDLSRQAGDAVVIDAAGTIAVPGFIDAHVHAWEGQLRGAAPVLDFGGYLGFTAFGYGPRYRPHDNYIGTLVTALVALNAGTTTIIDNSHNSRSPDHSNAAVEALIDSGIRGVHASGAPVGTDVPGWPDDVTRLRDEYFASEDQLVTLRLFDLYPSAGLWELAHREGLWMSHEMGSHIEDVADVLAGLDAKGLLTSDHAFNHCNALPEDTWALIKRSGAAVNLAPRSDAAFGVGTGFPPIDQARAAGLEPGLSGDNEVSYALSMFTEMQMLLSKHRGSVFGRITAGDQDLPAQLAPAPRDGQGGGQGGRHVFEALSVRLVSRLLVEPEDPLGVHVRHSRLVSGSQRRGPDELNRLFGGLKGVVDREHHGPAGRSTRTQCHSRAPAPARSGPGGR